MNIHMVWFWIQIGMITLRIRLFNEKVFKLPIDKNFIKNYKQNTYTNIILLSICKQSHL